jgi:hypothetical protein
MRRQLAMIGTFAIGMAAFAPTMSAAKAFAEPAHSLFRVIDADNNNQISLAELERAERILADQISRLRVPGPPNSLSHPARVGAGAGVVPSPAGSSAAATPR